MVADLMRERPPAGAFAPEAAAIIERNGWRILNLPAGLTLATLRQQGAPFRSDRYFKEFAGEVVETPRPACSIAYQPALLAGSLNLRYEACEGLIAEFNRSVPAGCHAVIGQAAAYVYVIDRHYTDTGSFPLAGAYCWTSDQYRETHLVVGVFGRERPIIVAPLPEKQGRGVGVMPLIVPISADNTD